ncbi:MAG: hypothetical protein E7607_06410 [Ruminococcaceae bacterium]|nr:hypothetical protein [Oscillospiraceae bacterium]
MKNCVLKRILPFVLTVIMLFSVAVPAFASTTDNTGSVGASAPLTETQKGPIISGKLEGGIYKLNIDAEALYEMLKDKRISKDELLQFIPEEALEALKDKNAKDAIAELAANFISADDLSELIALLPTDVLLDYFDISFIEKFISVEEILSLIDIDSILKGISEDKIEALITSEAFEILLNESLKEKVLTNQFISNLLENSGIVDDIVSDTTIRDKLAGLIDGKIVDKILANPTAKNNLIALAESQRVLDAVLGNPDILHKVQNYLFSHTEKINKFVNDPNVIGPMKASDKIKAHIADIVDAHYLVETLHLDYDKLAVEFGIDEQYVMDHKDDLGLTYEDALNYTTLEALIKTSNIDLEFLCDDKGITVEYLITEGYVTETEFAHIISDNWGNVVNDESFAKDIIEVVGIHTIFEDFGRDNIIHDVFGGYYEMIDLGLFTEAELVTAIGGYSILVDYLLPEKLEDIINVVGMDRWKEYVDVNDIVDAAGGYSALLSMYSNDELQAIIDAIGIRNIKDFVLDNGIKDILDIKGLAKDLISILKDKKSEYKTFAKEIFNLFTRILYNEFSTISINDTVIYKNGSFFIQEILTAIVKIMPDVEDVISMNSGEALAGFVITAPVRGETLSLGVEVNLVGDLTDLQSFLEAYKENFKLDVSDDLDVSLTVGIPAVLSTLYEKVLETDRIPDSLKKKLLELPTMTVADAAELINNITDEELEKLASAFAEKADAIRDKVYAKIDGKVGDIAAVQKAKDAADKIIEAVSDPEKLSSLKDKVYEKVKKVGEIAGDRSFLDSYNGNGSIHVAKSFSVDLYAIISKAITLPDDILVLFNNDMTISGSVDITVNTEGIYKVTVIEADGTVKTFLLPEGTDLGILNEYGLVDTDLSGKTVTGEDMVITHEDIYTLVFFDKDGNKVGEVFYTHSEPPVASKIPAVPTIEGYTGAWGDYTLYSDKIINVNPVYTEIEYDFGYKVNGTYTFSQKITVTTTVVALPDSVSANTGYEFKAWFIDLDSNGTFDGDDFYLVKVADGSYAAPAGKKLPLGDVIAVAEFDTLGYKATFYSEGNLFYTHEFTVTDTTLVLPSTLPANPYGYAFAGWFADLDGDGTYETAVSAGYTLPLKDISITATFSENFYCVYTKADGITTLMPDHISVNSTFVYLSIPEKQHYSFSKFYLEGNTSVELIKTENFKEIGGVKYYKFDLPASFSFPDSEVYFVAEFTPVEYTVTLDNLDGTTTNIKYNCETATVTIPEFSPVPAGKIFTGWYADLDGDGTYETKIETGTGASFASTYGNVTAIATFKDITYTATFEAIDSFTGATVIFTYGDTSLNSALIPAVPAKDGYDGAWYVRMADGNDIPLASYTLENKDITVYAKYERNRFTVTFTANGTTVDTVTFNKGETSIPANKIPAVPAKDGYAGAWYVQGANGAEILFSSYTLEDKDITVYAKYERNRFTVTFTANGTTVDTVTFNKGETSIPANKIPAVPAKLGYTGDWYVQNASGAEVLFSSYTLEDKDITVYAKYEEIIVPPVQTFTVTFVAGGVVVSSVTCDFGTTALDPSKIPAVPAKTGYTGAWESFVLNDTNITVNAVYTPIVYKAVFKADGKVIDEVTFTVEDTVLSRIPEVPAKTGYTGSWSKYTLTTGDIEINAVYVLNVYKATFIADNKVVAIVDFTVEDTSLTEPEVPYKEGYTGKWEEYTLKASNIVIVAVYTADDDVTPPVVVDPDDTTSDDDEKKERKWIAWLIFLIIGLAILAVWIITKLKDNDDDNNEPPTEPEVVPPVVPVEPVEEEPVHIDTVESVDVETADILMTDETAMAVVETVGGAGVGMKSIVNLRDINDVFSNGDVIDLDELKAKGLVPAKTQRVKILADGTLNKHITVYAEQFSVQAIKMITLTGGKAIQKK